MVLFYLGQVPAQWFTEAGDAALAGGVLRFYAVGTSTPKAVFSDYQGVTAAGTAVTLNASGRANVFLDGLYSVTLEDSEGVQIGAKVDGIGNAAMTGDGSTLVIETYDDLRQFDGTDFRACVVQGRTANGDGGSGLFVWDALETTADDGGAILAPLTLPLSGRWVRVRGDTLDPRWYGCRIDGTTADDTQLALALAASVTLKARLHFEGGYSRVTSNTAIPTGARVSCGEAAGLTATSSAVTLTVPAGAIFTGSAACFGGMLQPLFSGIDTPLIPLSWMGGASVDSMLDKWAAASGIAGQTYLLDKSVAGIIPAFLAGRHLDVVPGCVHTVNATAQSLDVDVIVPSATHWMSWGAIANIGSVNVGNRPCPVEWFGAVGDGTTDDSAPWKAGVNHGRVHLSGKYKVTEAVTTGATLELSGDLVNATGYHPASVAAMPAPCVIFSGASTRLTVPANGILAAGGIGIAFDDATGKFSGNLTTSGILLDNCVLFSAATLRILDFAVRSFESCSLYSKTIIEASSASYVSCSFGVGSSGVSSQISIDKVAYLNYLTPPSSGAVPPLVCRATDKSIQLGEISSRSVLLENFSFGEGTIVTAGASYTINADDPALTIFLGTGPIAVNLPTIVDMGPDSPRVRIIVKGMQQNGVTGDWVYIANAGVSCHWANGGPDPGVSQQLRIPVQTTAHCASIFVFADGLWAQI